MNSTQHENKRTNDNNATGENTLWRFYWLELDTDTLSNVTNTLDSRLQGEINGTSKYILGLPRGVGLPLDGSSSGRRSASVRRVSLRTLGQGCTQQFRTVPPQVVFSGWPTVATQASLSDNWHTSAQCPLRSGTRSPRGRSHLRLRFLSMSPPCHDRDTLREKGKFDCIKLSVLYCIK
ncbi:hypothetical protein PoB_002873300 [Plakobranchus ocellatus]|uniref:Uncharacterized protein n=1 Tax=Plakobranchus ocellatus TaxID=259542 RepID=A0AAV4A4V2_9GAST|nr:hypothetical protein PoB_002873300 [Plakobranchus ocellatus]